MSKYKLLVIGSPIKHTLSPLIHTTFIENLNLDCEYSVVEVKKGELESFIKYVKESKVTGFNITMPHKQDIFEFLDDVDEKAVLYNSVNTVKNVNGKLVGYNTDADGYKMSLDEIGVNIENSAVTILGAGGVSSALSIMFAREKAKEINILNRSIEKAKNIKDDVYKKIGFESCVNELTVNNIKAVAPKTDILLNTTPLGMEGIADDFEDLTFLPTLKKSALVSDLIYNPYKTNLLKESEKAGYKILNGLGMLIYQGLIADKIYFDKDFDFNLIKIKIQEKYFSRLSLNI